MEIYITELKTHQDKLLFIATKRLGDVMNLCLNVSRRSTCGSGLSSTLSVISDDVGDSHQADRPEKLQSHVLVRSSQTMLGIVIKLLDQRSYSHMFYSQIITDDVRDSH
jgi:hypothetical protein